MSSAAKDPRIVEDLEDMSRELERRTWELEQSEARFRDVIEGNADAIVVVDREGIVRFANSAAVRLFCADADTLLGTSFGFPLVADETTELDLVRDGEPRVAEMRVVQSQWEGRVAYIASLRDITERKRAEHGARRLIREQAARSAAEEVVRRLRFLLDSSTVLTSSLDHADTLALLARMCVGELADWTVVYSVEDGGPPRRLEVAHRDPAKAAFVRELRESPIDPASAHPVLRAIETRTPILLERIDDAQLAAMTSSPRELEVVRALGVASTMLVPMVARDHVLGAIALVSSRSDRPFDMQDMALAEDIAARAALAIDNARLYGEAQLANRTKADFLAVVSHDLRTPLNAILGYSDLLEMGIPERLPTPSLDHVGRIRTSAKHLLYLMNELLAFARLDAGREEIRLAVVDVRSVARDVAAVMEPIARRRALGFDVSIPGDAVRAVTDPDKLRQILLNLVGNAVKYTPRGEVRLALDRLADGVITIRVDDTGKGIAPENLDHIFEPFWQVDSTQRARGEGTGLGLSVVRRMAELLHGTVSVESTVGRGSTFTVTLPPLALPGSERDQ